MDDKNFPCKPSLGNQFGINWHEVCRLYLFIKVSYPIDSQSFMQSSVAICPDASGAY